MSWWTHINGNILVRVPGRSQAEIDYILQSVLDHMPRVTGSEGDMEVYINRHKGHSSSCSHDEYQMRTNNLMNWRGYKDKDGWLETQDIYTLVVHGDLRDRLLKETIKEFMNWLCRLSKRILVESVLVNIEAYDESFLINESGCDTPYWKMNESPSWANDTEEPAWWEHLMWKRFGDWSLPLEHIVKYYSCPEADAEYFKRFKEDD